MKKITFITLLFVLFLGINQNYSQKVAIIGMNHNSSSPNKDGFSFVALENLPINEEIYFTENEYNDSANAFTFGIGATGEGVIKLTLTSTVSKGDVVFVKETSTNTFTVTCSAGGACATAVISTINNNGSFSLATDGDGLYAYSDSDENVLNGITEIYSVMYTGSGEAPAHNGGDLPINENPINDFPNAIVVDGFSYNISEIPSNQNNIPDRTEFNISRDGVSKVTLENPTSYIFSATNTDLSTTAFTNLSLTGSNPILTVTATPSFVNENSGTGMVYTFSLDSPATSAITVNFSVGGTATLTSDYSVTGANTYTSSTGTVIIPIMGITASVTITPNGDTALEPDETVLLTITPGTGYDSGSPSIQTVTILNDDSLSVTPLVAITGTNNETAEGFSFVALDDIPTNTTIYFTDNEFNNNTLNFNSGEFVASWLAPRVISKGEVIVVKETSSNSVTTSCTDGNCGSTTIHSINFALATSGESLYAYLDSDNDPTNGILSIQSVLYTGNSTPGGNIPTIEDPTGVFSGSVLVDGFPSINPGRTEYDPTKRGVTVDQANFQNTGNWLHAQSNLDLSPTKFSNIIIATGSANPVATVAISPSNVIEDSTNAMVYTFSLDAPAIGNVILNFTVGGTATFTTDYTVSGSTSFTAAIGSVTILDGFSSASISITPVIDTTVEILENVELIIASGTGYNGGSPNSATGTISNDDTSNSDPLVAITGMNHVSPDGFSFVAAKDIPANSVIYFTENEFDNTTLLFSTGEAVLAYTSPGAVIPAGDVIVITETSPNVFSLTCNGNSGASCGSILLVANNLAHDTLGETLYAYEDSDNDPSNGVDDIYAVLFTGLSSSSGGSIPSNQDPSGIYLSALVVDGFPASAPNRTEYDATKRAVPVGIADFENVANWVHGQTNAPGLSPVPFAAIDIVDTEAPVASCKDNTIQLDAAGTISIVAADVDNISTDNIGIVSYSIDKTTFTCSDIGPNNVTLTVTDAAGNSATCIAEVTVEDKVAPTVTAVSNRNENVNAMCSFSIPDYTTLTTAADNCGIPPVMQSPAIGTVITGHGTVQTITLTVNDGNGNSNSTTFDITLVDAIIPTISTTVNIVESVDTNCNFALLDYTSSVTATDNCGTAAVTQSPSVGTIISGHGTSQTITLTANDGHGNSNSTTFDITLEDGILPSLTTVSNRTENLDAMCTFSIPDYTTLTTAADNCGTATVTQSPMIGTVISGHGTVQTITLTANDSNGNSDNITFDVSLADRILPTLTSVTDRNEDLNAMCSFSIPDYTNLTTAADNCGTATVTQSPILGTVISGHGTVQTITLTVNDGNGNSDSTSFDVTLVDGILPTLTTVSNRNENVDAMCTFSIPDYTTLTTAADNCGNATVTQSPILGTVISGHGTVQTITLTANDGNGNSDSTSFDVTLIDGISPTLTAVSNRTENLDTMCSFTIPDYTSLTTAADNCGTATVTQSPILGTVISGHGTTQTIMLTVNDGNGNSDSASFDVTLADATPPTITCPTDISVSNDLGVCGTTVNIPEMLEIGTGGVTSPDVLLLAADDINWITDVQNKLLATGAFNSVDVFEANNGTPDITLLSNYHTIFVWSDNGFSDDNLLGNNLVDYINSGGGVISMTFANASIPIGGAFNTDEYLGIVPSGQTSGTTETIGVIYDAMHPILNGVTNFSGGLSSYRSNSNTLSTGAVRIVDWTDSGPLVVVKENVGLSSVRRVDLNFFPPSSDVRSDFWDTSTDGVLLMQNAALWVAGAGNGTGASDNCSISSIINDFNGTSNATGFYPVGETTVIWTVIDEAGNSSTCSFDVTVTDSEAPIVNTQNITIQLDENGLATITPEQINDESTDNCGIDTYSLDISSFSCVDVGANTVTITVTDVKGNSNTGTATVLIEDTTPPTITCNENIFISNDPGVCEATITIAPPLVYDNCNASSSTALAFDGINNYVSGPNDVVPVTGEYTISVWAREANDYPGELRNIFAQGRSLYLGYNNSGIIRCGDSWGNTGVLFPTDNLWHHYTVVRKTNDTQLYIDGVLMASKGSAIPSPGVNGTWPHNFVVGSQWDSGHEFFDGQIDEIQIWNTSLTEKQITSNMSQILVGTENNLVAYFNFEDGEGSTILADKVSANNNGTLINMDMNAAWVASTNPLNLINLTNSYNNTSNASDVYPVGETIITWTATDSSGSSATCTQTITVEDNEPPTVITVAPFTLQLDEEGSTLSIAVEDIENGSSDNCGIESYALDIDTFDCSNVGENTVTLTVTDVNGNSETSTTIVTIEDNVAPVVITQNVIVELDSRGEAFIDTDNIDGGSFDNCDIASMSLDRTAFECSTLGDYTVVLTVVDVNGNTASEEAIVTVTADDIDGDLIADDCDDDMDGDNVLNETDNCVRTYNPDQRDLDYNGIGDVCDESTLFFPEGFSPNGDGIRDTFIIAGLHQWPDNELEIYNRWGNKVFSSQFYENDWDGIAKGGNVFNKNEKLPAGPYFYVLNVGYSKVYKGWIYINY